MYFRFAHETPLSLVRTWRALYHKIIFGMAYTRKSTSRRTPSRRRRSYARRRVYRRAPTKKRTTRRRKTMPVSKFTLAQLDPFSEKVNGVKIPDVNTQPSSTVVVEDTFDLVNDVNGLACQVFRPTLQKAQVIALQNTSNSWAWSAAYGNSFASSKATTITSNNTAIRSCAHGVRITCSLAPTTVTGFVHIAIVTESEFNHTTWTLPTSVAQLQTSQWYKRIPLAVLTQKPFKVVNKIVDPNGFRYYDPSSSLTGAIGGNGDLQLHTSGWANIIVCTTGVAAGLTSVSVESILHLETLPSPGSAQTVTPAANASSAAVEQATNVANSTPAVHEEGMFDSMYNSAAEGARAFGNDLYDASVRGAQAAGYQAVMGLGGAAYNWLHGTNARMIQY